MLDTSIIEQLKSVYQNLETEITLYYSESKHQKQKELIEMLTQVASTSTKILVKNSSSKKDAPHFEILKDGIQTGINFTGIPGGHEFTSLVLAILNTDEKGKLPDDRIIQRIKNLEGDIKLRTFISLSCENCPDIVQALNIMAIFNENIKHEMVDGEFAQKEAEELKLQGVPSVV